MKSQQEQPLTDFSNPFPSYKCETHNPPFGGLFFYFVKTRFHTDFDLKLHKLYVKLGSAPALRTGYPYL